PLRLPARYHAAPGRVLSRPRAASTGAPCVLARLGASDPEARQQHREGHVRVAWRERAFAYGVAVPFAFVLAIPFVWMVFTAFKSQAGVFNPERWPFSLKGDTWAGWGFLLHQTPYLRWLGNTAIVGGAVVAITLPLALPAGYALARLSGRTGQA